MEDCSQVSSNSLFCKVIGGYIGVGNDILRAKELYFGYFGNSFFMHREGVYEEYKSYNISKEQELIWKEELVENLFNRLTFEDTYALHKLALIAENYHDNNIVERLITYTLDNLDKGDSLIKLNYAEVLLKIACPKELLKIKLDLVSKLLESVSANPITFAPSWIQKGFAEFINEERIKNRLKKDLDHLAEIKANI